MLFRSIAATFSERIAATEKSFPRVVALDPALAALLPEVLIGVGPERFAAIADRVMAPKTPPVVPVEHIHRPLINVADESRKVIEFLRNHKSMSFRALCADADEPMVVIARFLALLDLYRTGSLRFEQVIALGELQISWIGTESGEVAVSDEFDIAIAPLEDSDELNKEDLND